MQIGWFRSKRQARMISRRLYQGCIQSLSIVPCPCNRADSKVIQHPKDSIELKGAAFSQNILRSFPGFVHDLLTLLCHSCQKVLSGLLVLQVLSQGASAGTGKLGQNQSWEVVPKENRIDSSHRTCHAGGCIYGTMSRSCSGSSIFAGWVDLNQMSSCLAGAST